MTHADTLRGMAGAFMVVGSRERVETCLAGAEALDTVERVRHALSRIAYMKADTENSRGHDDDAEWHAATSEALESVIDLLTEALEGDI